MPKVSIIIPVYNVEQYLSECLNSIVNQTLKDIEIICVNDGSTDSSLNILEKYAEYDSRIVIFSQENKGQSVARNVGLSAASGEYVYFMDSDDVLSVDAIKTLFDFATEEKTDVIYFGADVFFESEKLKKDYMNYLNYYDRKGNYPDIYTGLEMLALMNKYSDYRPSPCLQFFDKNFLYNNKIEFYEGIIHEDNLFSLMCIVKAEKVRCIENKFFHRRMRESSTMTQEKSAKNVIGYFTCFIESVKYSLQENEKNEDVKKQVESFLRNARTIYNTLPETERKKITWEKDSFETFMFEILVKNQVSAKNNDLTSDAVRCIALQSQLNDVYQSKSYRIGRMVTFVPRKFRATWQCYKDNGLKYTIWRIGKEFSKILPRKEKKIGSVETTRSQEIAVSIIVPIYNVENYLKQCLDSLLDQTMRNIEIICVNDGSPDNCKNILEEYAKKDSRVRVIEQFNQYLGFARNTGLRRANGEYVLFIDSDDFVELDLVERTYQKAKQTNADIVAFSADIYNQATEQFSEAPWMLQTYRVPKKEVFSASEIKDYIFNFTAPNAWTQLYRREFLENNNLYFPPFKSVEDVPHTYHAYALANRITVENKALVHYRKGITTNISSNKDDKALFFYDSYSLLQSELIESGKYSEMKKSFVNRCLAGCIYEIDSLKTEDAKKKVKQYLADEIAQKLDLIGHGREYYYNISDYDKLQSFLAEAESWEETQSGIKVSVIVPVYNAELYLAQCLDSLLNQTLKEIEIICVDDGSIDASMDILRKYEQCDSRIKVLAQKNNYAGVARNFGMRQSKGEYVIFLDADDFFEPELLEQMYLSCKINNSEVAICAADSFHDTKKIYNPMPWQLNLQMLQGKKVFSPTELSRFIFVFCTGVPWNKMFKREYVKELKLCFQDTRCANDLYFTMLAMVNANKISVVDKVLVHYRIGITTNLQSSNTKNPFDFCRPLMGIRTELIRVGLYEKYEQSFVNLALNNCMYNLKKNKDDAVAYRHLLKKLQDFYFPLFGVDQHEESYFFDKNYWNEYKQLKD